METKYKFLSKNMLLFSISSFGQKILAFLLVPLYTNVLSTAEYGTVDLVTTTVNLLLPVFTLNISESVMRFTLDDKDNTQYVSYGIKVVTKGALVLLFGIVLFSLTPYLASYRQVLLWLYLIYAINSVYSLQQNYLRAIDKVDVMITGSLINSLIMMALNVILLTQLKWGITGYFVSIFFGLICSCIFMERNARIFRNVHYNINNEMKIRADCLKYCIPTIFTALAWWINSSLDKFFVTVLCGVGQNGIYSISYKIPTILGIFQTIFVQAWTLSAISEFDKDDKDGFFGKTYELYNSMMVLVCSCIILGNMFLSSVLYAKDFFIAWKCVPLLLISSLFSALSGYLGSVFSAVKDTKTCAYTTILSAFVNIVLNALLIPKFGIVGASMATALAYIVAWFVRMVVSRRYIRMKYSITNSLVTYFLLAVQAVAAMTESHFYFAQVLMCLAVFLVNGRIYIKAFQLLICKYKSQNKRGK